MNIETFTQMVRSHDLTFGYSDDHRAYTRGRDERNAIESAAKLLPEGEAARIWNENIDRQIGEGFRAQFYWRG
jgi:hypothetical protein